MGYGRRLGGGLGAFSLGAGGGGEPAPPDPNSKLVLWYDADKQAVADGIADGTATTPIKNYGSAGATGDAPKTSTTGAVVKLAIQNGRAIFRFANSERHSTGSIAALIDPTAVSVYSVAKYGSTNTTDRTIVALKETTGRDIGHYKGTNNQRWSVAHADTLQSAANDLAWRLMATVYGLETHSYWRDGAAVGSHMPVPAAAASIADCDVGCLGTGGLWIGDIGAILIYNEAHSDTQRQAVEAYLATRWGITI